MPSLEFLYNGLFFWLLALGTVPIVQLALWKIGFRWVVFPIVALLLLPGILFLLTGFYFTYGETGKLERWELAYALTAPNVAERYAGMFALFFVSLGLWLSATRIAIRKLPGCKAKPPAVIKPFAVLLAVVLIGCVYLCNYTTLQAAVDAGNIDLARRRLQFNLSGSGANNGAIFHFGTLGLRRFPLLPMAVERGNKKMVALLIENGGELNNGFLGEGNFLGRPLSHNVLYFAVMREDMEMLDFLLASGADPTQGIRPAVRSGNKKLLNYLIENGADVAAAQERIIPTRRKKFQEQLDSLLP